MTLRPLQILDAAPAPDAEHALIDAARDVADLLDLGSAGVICLDGEGRARFANRCGQRFLEGRRLGSVKHETEPRRSAADLSELARCLGSSFYDALGHGSAAPQTARPAPTEVVLLSAPGGGGSLAFVRTDETDPAAWCVLDESSGVRASVFEQWGAVPASARVLE